MFKKVKSSFQSNKKIIAFLSSQAISLFGSSLVQYAIMWNITLSSQSGMVLAIYGACSFLPQILVSLFAGVLADRYNRKMLIMVADGTIALSTLALMFIIMAGNNSLVPIYIVAVIRSIGGGVQTPAVNAILPQIAPENKLMRVNSINGTIQAIVQLAAPAVAGAVLAMGSLPQILMIDVVTAAIGIGILAFIRIAPNPHALEKRGEKLHIFADLRTGVQYATGNFFVRRLTLYALFANLLVIPLAMFNVLFITRTYGGSYFFLTTAEVAFFAGSIIGGIVLAASGGFKNRILTIAAGSMVFGMVSTAIGFAPPFWFYLVLMFCGGLAMPTFQAPVMAMLQEKVPGEILGRVFSLMQIVGTSVILVGSMIFGPLFDVVSIGFGMKITGVLMLAYTFILFADKKFLQQDAPHQKITATETAASQESAL